MTGPRFTPEISLGQVIQAIVVAGTVGVAVFTYVAKIDTAQHDIASMRLDMNGRFDQVRVDTNSRLDQVRVDIANLPDLRAELAQVEKRLDQIDNRSAAQSARLEQVQQMAVTARADLDSVIRASAAQVGRRP
jgi:Tfp pilus assembly protein PilO